MTTKFQTIDFAFSVFYCHGVTQEKRVLGQFPLCPSMANPSKKTSSIFIVIVPSLIIVSDARNGAQQK